MKLKKFLLVSLGAMALGAMVGCGGDDWAAPEMELSATSVTADAVTGEISVTLTIKNFANLGRIEVTKVDGGSNPTEKLLKKDLSAQYEYLRTVTAADPDRFLLEFRTVGTDGKLSPARTLEVLKSVGRTTVSLDRNVVALPASHPSGEFSVVLTIGGFAQLDHLVVEHTDWGETTSRDIPASELSPRYTFSGTVTEADSDLFTIRFTAVDREGARSGEEVLTVDRRSRLGFRNLKVVSRVTGAEDNRAPMPTPEFTLDNATDTRYNVGGTDLGIVWELDPGRYGLFFGDTFGSDFAPNFAAPGPSGGSWRSNVLLFSDDGDLSDGMTIDGAAVDAAGRAREICFSAKDTSGNGDYTAIPTAAVRANGYDYVHYMNIKTWNGWVTNLSSFYRSGDDGTTWERCNNTVFNGWSNFGQVGLFNKEGYVYVVGTVSGRANKPHLARVVERNIERVAEYEFWNGTRKEWVKGNESAATVLIDDIAGELSIAYHRRYGKWIILYFNDPRYEITYREANEITGPWSEPRRIAGGNVYPQLYGSYIHPLSLEGDKLWFVMSMWLPYNTYLMSVDLVRE